MGICGGSNRLGDSSSWVLLFNKEIGFGSIISFMVSMLIAGSSSIIIMSSSSSSLAVCWSSSTFCFYWFNKKRFNWNIINYNKKISITKINFLPWYLAQAQSNFLVDLTALCCASINIWNFYLTWIIKLKHSKSE